MLVEWEEGWRDKANITRDAGWLLPTTHLALDRGIIVNDTITIVYLHNVDIWDQHSSPPPAGEDDEPTRCLAQIHKYQI
jgi:hypothetical protein